MFFSFKKVETIKGVKLSLALLCAFVFLFACVPTALSCSMDIKPGSYPNSINVDNNGVITIAVEYKEGCSYDLVEVSLEQKIDAGSVPPFTHFERIQVVPENYKLVDPVVIDPKLTGLESDGYYKGPGYVVKFRTEDLSDVFFDPAGKLYTSGQDNLYLRINFGGVEYIDSVRLLSNSK